MNETDEFAADTCEPRTVDELAEAHRKMISTLSPENGVYRVADVEALVNYCEARMRNTRVYDASVFNRIAATDSDTQLRDAWEAITDDLLARCRREPR